MTDDNDQQRRTGSRRPWIPDLIADRYEIERELGAGATAVTVAAHDRRLGRRVAIKILRPHDELDPAFSQRFTREARAAASITHPHVVSVYDVGHEGELLYLVMQFVDGTDLKRVIERDGALPWERAVKIATSVLAGLTPIHEVGIVHRDIKPQNVLIGSNGEVKVTDFGVAHMELDTSLTVVGTTVGTAAYMAPEQAQGRTPTPAADVYAVGVMLYEMVTGRLPFDEPTSVATMLAHIQRQPDPPIAPPGRQLLPAWLVSAIRRAMAKDPGDRFRTAAAMQGALEHLESLTETQRIARPTGNPTQVVANLPPTRSRSRLPSSPTSVGSRPGARATGSAGRGFGATFAMLLLLLAVAFAGVAGAMWVFNERPDLLGGGGTDGSEPTVTVAVTPTPAPDPTPTSASDVPAVIEPIDEEPEPTPTLPPVPTPTPPPTPTPVPPTVMVIEPLSTEPADDDERPQIIEPIQGSTVVIEPED
jgi:eukaryotic-like serine/threonine-protein kinase